MVNCAFPTCTVSRTQKYDGTSLFKLPTRKGEMYTAWRKNLLDLLSKYREMSSSFKKEVMECKRELFICERHYAEEDIEFTKTGIKTPRLEALPTKNLPLKSHEETSKVERRLPTSRVTTSTDEVVEKEFVYKNLEELYKRVQKCKWVTNEWCITSENNIVKLTLSVQPHIVPYLEVVIDEHLKYTIIVFGWLLPNNHPLYENHCRSAQTVTVSNLLHEIKSHELCPGLPFETKVMQGNKVILHVIPCHVDLNNQQKSPIATKTFKRDEGCIILCNNSNRCSKCEYVLKKIENKKISIKPLHPNTPLSIVNPDRIIETLKLERKENKELRKRLEKEILLKSVDVDKELACDFDTIMSDNVGKMTPFMKLFWEQQKQFTKNKAASSNRYHPMIIRFCLSLASKSASAYDELRSSNILTLPSRRTLRDYKNAIKPHAGFNSAVIQELIKTTKSFDGCQRNIVLSFDEMKIQENLVYDKYSGDLVGYVNLGDPDLNYASFDDHDDLATHVLVFYVTGLASKLKFELGYLGTKGILSYQIMCTFWRAVAILEDTCNLRVIAVVSDGASSNRSFIKMHKSMSNITETDIVYRTINLYHPQRYICFFADTPHLMKTTRNCMYHSGSGTGKTRLMWNDGKEIIWSHIVKAVQDDENKSLKLISKLREEHIRLNPYSKMNVRLATQVLSESVSKHLYTYHGPECHGTADLCMMMDKFFDLFNIKNDSEHITSIKEFLKPFKSPNDKRFEWLNNDFLPYFERWRESVEHRKGNFTTSDRKKMFLSHQTYTGILISVHSVIEMVSYLLRAGTDHDYCYNDDGDIQNFVLTGRVSQDPTEENFGRHRAVGRRNEHPSLYQFGYDSNMIRMSRSVVPVTGNTKGAHQGKKKLSWSIVDQEPLPKRKK